MSVQEIFNSGSTEGDDQWVSVSDLMAGLMVIFLFVAISYMKDIRLTKDQMEEVAVKFQVTQERIYKNLLLEFREDLKKWKATLDEDTLTISFREPSIYFDSNSAIIKPGFQKILYDFFPRYLNVLDGFKGSIEEIRIEGHTSSEWEGALSEDDAYFKNMTLSQSRTRAVLQHVLTIPEIDTYKKWARKTITANGLSSSRPILINGQEARNQSRRVDFRVKTNAEVQIRKILKIKK